MENTKEPLPLKYDPDKGLMMWEIKATQGDHVYEIWAYSYEKALEILSMIEQPLNEDDYGVSN